MKSITLFIGLIIGGLCHAQTDQGALVQNQPQTAELKDGETHIYSVSSEGDQFMVLVLEQMGIDVHIVAKSPEGKQVAYFDSPNGQNGPEKMTLAAEESGVYTFEVSPFADKPEPGNYSIELFSIEPLAKTPAGRIDQLMCFYSDETAGVSVAVQHKGELVFSKGYGLANLEYSIPVDNETIFHIASVSKQFTAFAILLLAEDGKLDVDDDIRIYIPEVPDFGHTITLRQLANHTSGLRDQWNLLSMAGWRMDDVITTEQVLKIISRQKDLNFLPNEEHLYCNTGFTLLAEVVARVSGRTFDEFCQQRIFTPLGMKNTLFYEDHERIVKNRAYSYYMSPTGYKKSVLSYATAGATSLFTTPEDLMKWSSNFLNPVVGNEETMKIMHTEGVLNDGSTYGYAFGQAIGEYKGLTNYSHGGADAGFRSYLTRFPNEQLAVAVFGNESAFNSYGTATAVLEMFAGDLFQVEEEPEEFTEEESDDAEAHVVDAAVLANYVGEFEIQPGFNLAISMEGDELKGQATGQSQFDLSPVADTLFTVGGVEAKIAFPNGSEGPVPHLTLYQGGRINVAQRLVAFDKNSVDLAEFTGTYYSDELATAYSIDLVNDTLIVEHSKLSDSRLDVIKPDMFNCSYWALGQVDFLRDEGGEITGLKVSNGRVRNVYFTKEIGE